MRLLYRASACIVFAVPVVLFVAGMVLDLGWRETAIVWAMVVAVFLWIGLGVWLTDKAREL